jgi:hypothetical protein
LDPKFWYNSDNPNPLKIPQNPQKHVVCELRGTLGCYKICQFGARDLEFGTVFTNIIQPWIRNLGTNRTTPTPKKYPKPPKHFEYELMETLRL